MLDAAPAVLALARSEHRQQVGPVLAVLCRSHTDWSRHHVWHSPRLARVGGRSSIQGTHGAPNPECINLVPTLAILQLHCLQKSLNVIGTNRY